MSEFKLMNYFTDEKKYNNFYEIFHFFININFDLDSLKNEEKESYEKYTKLLHEYTHYLQGFCTVFGAKSLLKYFELQIDLFTKVAEKKNLKEKITLEIYKSFKNQYCEIKDNYNYFEPFNDNLIDHYCLFTKEVKNPIINKNQYEHFIKLDTDFCVHVSPKCLRETMAMMTYFNFMKLSNDEILKYLKQEHVYPEYSYLYLYFKKTYPKINDLVPFLYYFTELCLQTINPTEYIQLILDDLAIYYDSYIYASKYFDDLLYRNPKIRDKIEIEKKILEIKMKKLDEISEKGEEYFHLISLYMNNCITGLQYILDHGTLFKNRMDLHYILFFVNYFSSPIIIQKLSNKPKKIICLDKNENRQTNLSIYFGLSVILEQYIIEGEKFSKCPFLQDIPICNQEDFPDIDINLCARNPYAITSRKDGNCLFYNVHNIIGFYDED